MNPLSWVRWKVVVALALAGGLLYFLGRNPLALWQLNGAGGTNPAARWQAAGIDLGILSGDYQLRDFLVGKPPRSDKSPAGAVDAKSELEKVFNATLAAFDLSTVELLRRRFVVEKLAIEAPRMSVERRPDGSTNLEELGDEPDGREAPALSDVKDWADTAVKWYRRIESWRAKLPQGREDEKKRAKDAQLADYYSRRVEYPFAGRPGMVIERIEASGFEVEFSEAAPERTGELPALRKGRVTLTGLSSRPALHPQPIRLDLEAELAGSPFSLGGELDLRREPAAYRLGFEARELTPSAIEAFVGPSLPVKLLAGSIGLAGRLELRGDDGILIAPKLRFQDVKLEAKDPAGKIAGVDARKFTAAFNEASEALAGVPLEIADLRITGTLSAPRFEWGDTVKNLVLEGGKAFAAKQLQRAEELAGKEASKLQEKLEGKLGKELDRALGDTPLGKEAKEQIDKLLPGKDAGKDAAKDAGKEGLDFLRRNIFGGKSEEKKEK